MQFTFQVSGNRATTLNDWFRVRVVTLNEHRFHGDINKAIRLSVTTGLKLLRGFSTETAEADFKRRLHRKIDQKFSQPYLCLLLFLINDANCQIAFRIILLNKVQENITISWLTDSKTLTNCNIFLSYSKGFNSAELLLCYNKFLLFYWNLFQLINVEIYLFHLVLTLMTHVTEE